MQSNSVGISEGKLEDLPGVLELIKELAKFENAESEVEITLDQLEKDGFGEFPSYKMFVARDQDIVVGVALYFLKYSTWKGKCVHLEDLVVKETYRRAGVGTELFNKMIAISKEIGARRLEWQVLEWNQSAIDFYKKYNANIDTEWFNGKLTFEQIQSYNQK